MLVLLTMAQLTQVLKISDLRSPPSSSGHSIVYYPTTPSGAATAQALFALRYAGTLGQSRLLDSGVSFHITPYSSTLASYTPLSSLFRVFLPDGYPLPVTHKGFLTPSSYPIGRFHVPFVLYIPKISLNLFSVIQIIDHDCLVYFDSLLLCQDRRTVKLTE